MTIDSPDRHEAIASVQRLFIKHANSIRGFLYALAADGQLLDDVMHSTFLALTEKAEQYDPARPFVPWARGFARNELLQAMQRTARRPQLLSPEALERLQATAPDFAEEDDRVAALQACFEKLSPRARQAIAHRYRDALAPPEIAERMQLAIASVNVSLSRARAFLKQCVELTLRRGG